MKRVKSVLTSAVVLVVWAAVLPATAEGQVRDSYPAFPAGAPLSFDTGGSPSSTLPASVRTPAGITGSRIEPRYPFGGAVIGGVAGAVLGIIIMKNTDDWMGAPAPVFMIPVGAVIGFSLGLVAGALADEEW